MVTFLLLVMNIMPILNNNILFVNECEIDEFYNAVDADYGTKVLTSLGNLEDAEIILLPTKLDEGDYKVNVTRKATNLYKVEGTKYYIQTKYCYEYSYSGEAILTVGNQYGYTKGKLIFK